MALRSGQPETRSLPRHIAVRRGREEDEFATFDVMRRTMNAEMSWANHAATRHHLRTSPDASFWLAEESSFFGGPKVIGYARSIVREGVWSLTEFFVLPGHHRQGIGGELLSGCLADGAEAGADTHLVLASHHPGADALYVRRAGCFPRLPMLLLAGQTSNLRTPETVQGPILDALAPSTVSPAREPAFRPQLFAEPILPSPALQAELDLLDRQIVGYARPPEHHLWMTHMGGMEGASRLFRDDAGQLVGYAYHGPHSSGPVLALDPADQPRLFSHVAHLARNLMRNASDLRMLFPVEQLCAIAGTNETMLNWLLSCGWQIVFQYLFMSSRPLGAPDRYICHNPLYFL